MDVSSIEYVVKSYDNGQKKQAKALVEEYGHTITDLVNCMRQTEEPDYYIIQVIIALYDQTPL